MSSIELMWLYVWLHRIWIVLKVAKRESFNSMARVKMFVQWSLMWSATPLTHMCLKGKSRSLTQDSEHSQTVQCLTFRSPRSSLPIAIACHMEWRLASHRNCCGTYEMHTPQWYQWIWMNRLRRRSPNALPLLLWCGRSSLRSAVSRNTWIYYPMLLS